MPTYGDPFVKYFTDKNGINVYNSSANPGAAGDTYSGVGVKQNPRLTQNVTVQTGLTGVPGGRSSAVRCWTRQAPVAEGNTAANWWSTSGFALTGGRQKWGKWEYAIRRQEGLNTKGVWLLWPIGSNKNGWLNAPPGSCNEADMIEWFDQSAAGGVAMASCNMHYRKADGTVSPSYQKSIPHPLTPGVDWVNWHVVTFIMLPNQTDMLIDGIRAAQFPLTANIYLQQVQMYFAAQMALLIDPGLTRATTSRETAWMDTAYIKVYPLLDAQQESAPSIPANLQAFPNDQTHAQYTWSAAVDTDPNSPVHDYPLQRAPVSGGLGGTIGAWAQIADPTATSYRDSTGLTSGSVYAIRVAAKDTANMQSEWSDPVQFQMPSSPANPAPIAKLIIKSVDDGTITSENGAITANAPFNGYVDPTQSSGTITKVDIDYGDGTTYPGVVMPGSPTALTHLWETPDEITVTLTVWGTDPGTGILPFSQDTVTLRLKDPTTLDATPNYGWFLPKQGNPIRADELYEFVMGVDDALAKTLNADDVYQDPDQLMLGSTLAGEDYRRFHMKPDGRMFWSDGTYPPTNNSPLLGPGGTLSGGTPPPPAAGDIQFSWVATNDSGAGTANPHTVQFPTSVPTGYALVFLQLRNNSNAVTTPAGWTLLGSDGNGNSNCRLLVYGKTCGSGDNNATVSFVVGATEGAVVMVGYINTATTGTIVASMVTKNVSTAQTAHPTPNTLDSTTTNQVEVRCVGVRYSSGTIKPPPDVPAELTPRGSGATSSTAQTNVALAVGDRKLATITTDSTASAFKTGTGAFSVGATVILAHV